MRAVCWANFAAIIAYIAIVWTASDVKTNDVVVTRSILNADDDLIINEEIIKNISKLEKNDESIEEGILKMMPIGTIIAWIPKPVKGDASRETLPPGWMECDGSYINNGRWTNLQVPDLNHPKHFLRGGNRSNYLTEESDAMEDLDIKLTKNEDEVIHSHAFIYHKHTHDFENDSGGGVTHKECNVDYHDDDPKDGTTKDGSFKLTYVNITLEMSSSIKESDETRPINSAIIWIIRVE